MIRLAVMALIVFGCGTLGYLLGNAMDNYLDDMEDDSDGEDN